MVDTRDKPSLTLDDLGPTLFNLHRLMRNTCLHSGSPPQTLDMFDGPPAPRLEQLRARYAHVVLAHINTLLSAPRA